MITFHVNNGYINISSCDERDLLCVLNGRSLGSTMHYFAQGFLGIYVAASADG